jgi:hypothetical protein
MGTQSAPLGEGHYRTVRLNELVTDGRFNRPVRNTKVEEILSDFNIQALGTIKLWERDNGELVIIDGQHRVEALRRKGVPEGVKCIPAIVYRGTLGHIARLFVQFNNTKQVSAYDKYHALLTAGDVQTRAIDQTVRTQELIVGPSTADGTLSCVDAVRKVFCMGEPEGAVLGKTLAALVSAWGPTSEAYRSPIVRGVGRYFHEHRETDPEELAEALVRGPGAPINLIGWAKTIAGQQRMPLEKAIAEVIENRVMKRKKGLRSA